MKLLILMIYIMPIIARGPNYDYYHISDEITTIRYYFEENARNGSGYTWTTDISEELATSSTCVIIGGGWHSRRYAVSAAVSYYWLINSSYSSLGSIMDRVSFNSNKYV